MSIETNLKVVQGHIEEAAASVGRTEEDVTLVAISKGRNIGEIREAYSLGLRDFGENRVTEALEKMEALPSDIRWHFIGKLQKNKVSKVIGRFSLIHSVDTPELAEKISNASEERGLSTPILLEANISGEETKSGLSPEAWEKCYQKLLTFKGIDICGLMTMAPLTENERVIRRCFSGLRSLRDRLEEIGGQLSILSMGMSHDFPLAIQEGSSMIRIGSALFHNKLAEC